ncbi:MAG: LytR C-terminal domain-containing protein [Actinomycetota bacterium]
MNLGTGRIVVIVALLVVGAAVLANGFADGGSALQPGGGPSGSAAATGTPSDTPTGSTSSTPPPTPEPEVEGVVIQVFNGTNVPGLGATAQAYLVGKGYTADVDALDAPSKPVPKTIVYFRGGPDAAQNESNATNMAKKYFKGAKVAELDPAIDDLVAPKTQLAVVVGDDYAATTV